MAVQTSSYPCYALQVRSGQELKLALQLRHKYVESIVPVYQVRRRWSDRYVTLELPMIPGYVFCRFDLNNRLPVLCTDGVQRVVGVGKTPVPICETELESLRIVETSGLRAAPCSFQRGELVRIDYGPLSGVCGAIVEVKNQYRLIVSISFLQRSVAVEIDRDWVRPLPTRRDSIVPQATC